MLNNTGSVLTRNNIDSQRSPKYHDGSFALDESSRQFQTGGTQRVKDVDKYDEIFKKTQLKLLTNKKQSIDEHKQRTYVRPTSIREHKESIKNLYKVAPQEKQLEIRQQVLQTSRRKLDTYQSDGDSPNQSPRAKRSVFANQIAVNNENFQEVKKRMEDDLETLKKVQKLLRDSVQQTYISSTTKSRLNNKKSG